MELAHLLLQLLNPLDEGKHGIALGVREFLAPTGAAGLPAHRIRPNDGPGGDPDGGGEWRDVSEDDGACPDLGAVPHANGAQDFGPDADNHSVPKGWVALSRSLPVPPRVTPWYIVTSSPMTVVSPMTTPIP